MAGPCRIPKLTVRVRFPSPAPCPNTVAAEQHWGISDICRACVSVSALPLWATDIHNPKAPPPAASAGRSACSITFSGCPFFGSSNHTRVYLRKHELDVDGLNYSAAKKHDE